MHVMRLRGRPPFMFILLMILFCLLQTSLPAAAQLVASLETQAIVPALGVFAFLSCRLWLNQQPRRPPDAVGKNHR